MGYNNWQKGSQWRKWDLHVHTPASFHWKGGKLLRDMSSAEKDLVTISKRQKSVCLENSSQNLE